MAEIEFRKVCKAFDDGTVAVKDLDLRIDDGEFVVFVGPSGCGKSTSLRLIAGLEEVTSGELLIGGQVVNRLSPKERDIAMVFQSYALYPHMTVSENMGFALKLAKVGKPGILERVGGAASTLGLSDLLHRKPRELSGGQRQRVAMGRAIVRSPKAFLMDEPLSNLDAKLRVQMRAEISHLQEELSTTMLYVTHDQVEAMTMGDRVAVMRLGELQQYDSPRALYETPANLFVAGFIGSPPMNLCQGTIEQEGGDLLVRFGSNAIVMGPTPPAAYGRVAEYVGRQVAVGMRPESFFRSDARVHAEQHFRAQVDLVEVLGAEALVHLKTDAQVLLTDEIKDAFDDEETFKDYTDQQRAGLTMIARVDARYAPERHEVVEVPFDIDGLHFFSLETGEALN